MIDFHKLERLEVGYVEDMESPRGCLVTEKRSEFLAGKIAA